MQRINLKDQVEVSRIIHGYMRLNDWNLSNQELLTLIKGAAEIGVTTIDQADIYGDYSCESLLGKVFKEDKGLRDKLEVITKCGIKLLSDKYPERKIKYYDYSKEHITESVNTSLKNLNTDYIDILLLHRPSPLFDPEEVANAFRELKKSGKVRAFGVSNFTSEQITMLQSYLEDELVTNQVEISPICLTEFENGNMDFYLKGRIHPIAWSPLAGGTILQSSNNKENRIHSVLNEIKEELNLSSIDQVAYTWILKHPSKVIPIVGSGKITRIKVAVDALDITMTLEQWFRIYNASTGTELP